MYNNTEFEESDEVSEEEKRHEGNIQEGNEKSMSDKPDEGNDEEEEHDEAENERTRAQDEDVMNNVDQGGPQDDQKKGARGVKATCRGKLVNKKHLSYNLLVLDIIV